MTTAHPFIEGFKQGVHPDFTPGQDKESVPMTIPAAELRKLSATYGCSVKTLRRLASRGIDPTDPEAIAAALAGQRNVSPPMLKTAVSLAVDRIKADFETTI